MKFTAYNKSKMTDRLRYNRKNISLRLLPALGLHLFLIKMACALSPCKYGYTPLFVPTQSLCSHGAVIGYKKLGSLENSDKNVFSSKLFARKKNAGDMHDLLRGENCLRIHLSFTSFFC